MSSSPLQVDPENISAYRFPVFRLQNRSYVKLMYI